MTRAATAHPGFAQGVAAAFGAMLIWGGQLPIAKGAFVALDGYSMTVARYAIAAAALVLLLWWKEGRAAFAFEGRARPVLFAGTIGLGVSGLLLFIGLSLTRPEVAVIVLALQPAMAALAEWVLQRRPPPRFTLVCIAVGFAGVALVVTRGAGFGRMNLDAGELLGDLLVLLAAIAWVGYAVTTARMVGWSALRVSTLTTLPGLAVIVLIWGIAHAFGQVYVDPSALPSAAWRLAYISLVGVVLGMILWNAGLQRIGSVNGVLILNLMPIVTFAFRAFEGARFELVELAGAAIVVGALLTNSLMLRRSPRRA